MNKLLLLLAFALSAQCNQSQHQKEIEDMFAKYDVDKSNKLTKKELYDGILSEMGKFEPSETTLKDLRKTVKEIFTGISE